jgi:hypothetical protein
MPRFLSIIVVAVLLLSKGMAFAQSTPKDPGAAANIRESEQYTALLRSSPAFRKKREAIECGPITFPQLRASCIASFEAYAAPASPPRRRKGA